MSVPRILISNLARTKLFVFFFQKAQSKKGKAAEKSPQDEMAPPTPGSDPTQLDAQITKQGDKVRDLKKEKAPKVGAYI